MKKLDEIMEVFTEEIERFSTTVNRMERLAQELKTTKVKVDTHEIRNIFREKLEPVSYREEAYQEQIRQINKRLKQARLVPKWQLFLFLLGIVLTMATLMYFGYRNYHHEKERETLKQVEAFFIQSPEATSQFREWIQTQESEPSRQ